MLDTAQELLDAGGPEAASVRGIAKALGVAPNTIYTYYPDRAAIMEALVERLLGGVDHGVFADRSQPWRQRVEAVALELRDQLTVHPGALGLVVGDPMSGPNALALNERIRELFTDVGLHPTDAARASHVLVVYILGSLALEIAHPDSPEFPSHRDMAGAAPTSGTSTSPSGRIAPAPGVADATMHGRATDQYLWGLHRLLDGLTGTTFE